MSENNNIDCGGVDELNDVNNNNNNNNINTVDDQVYIDDNDVDVDIDKTGAAAVTDANTSRPLTSASVSSTASSSSTIVQSIWQQIRGRLLPPDCTTYTHEPIGNDNVDSDGNFEDAGDDGIFDYADDDCREGFAVPTTHDTGLARSVLSTRLYWRLFERYSDQEEKFKYKECKSIVAFEYSLAGAQLPYSASAYVNFCYYDPVTLNSVITKLNVRISSHTNYLVLGSDWMSQTFTNRNSIWRITIKPEYYANIMDDIVDNGGKDDDDEADVTVTSNNIQIAIDKGPISLASDANTQQHLQANQDSGQPFTIDTM